MNILKHPVMLAGIAAFGLLVGCTQHDKPKSRKLPVVDVTGVVHMPVNFKRVSCLDDDNNFDLPIEKDCVVTFTDGLEFQTLVPLDIKEDDFSKFTLMRDGKHIMLATDVDRGKFNFDDYINKVVNPSIVGVVQSHEKAVKKHLKHLNNRHSWDRRR